MPVEIIKYGDSIKATYQGSQNGILKTVIAGSAQAKALCAVDKGELRNSIGYTAGKDQSSVSGGYNKSSGEPAETFLNVMGKGLVGYYGTAVDYAAWVENGTRVMVAQPFLKPSADILSGTRTAMEVAKELSDQMKKEVRTGTKATRIIR